MRQIPSGSLRAGVGPFPSSPSRFVPRAHPPADFPGAGKGVGVPAAPSRSPARVKRPRGTSSSPCLDLVPTGRASLYFPPRASGCALAGVRGDYIPVRCSGPGPPLGTLTQALCGGLAPGRPLRAPGYPTLLSPSGRGGGFNVSSPAPRPPGRLAGWSARGSCRLPLKPNLSLKLGNLCLVLKNQQKLVTTLSGGSLGSCVDEERS